MFDGCWIAEEENEERSVTETLFWYMDKVRDDGGGGNHMKMFLYSKP